jgi:protein involved in polysaccharide export with SLBB domain
VENMMVRSIILALAAMSLSACQTTAPVATAPITDGAPARVAEYQLGSGDQVRLIVFGEERLSGQFVVDGGGRVSLPLIGEVQAGGQTLREFEQSVVTLLRDGYLNDPRVSAEVLNYRPYYILGEVEIAGEYPYTDGLTVMNAVATAGGFTYRANTRTVHVKRAGEGDFVQMPLSAVTSVQPGDTIRIGERFF